MTGITIITIVVIILLTAIIFGLAWLAYSSCLKSYKQEVDLGRHDDAIRKEHKKVKKGGAMGVIGSWLILFLLSSLFVIGIVNKASGEILHIGNQTSLVIASSSMSDYFNDNTKEKLQEYNTYHFDIGDICQFDILPENAELVKGEVYGYKNKNIIITHRLVDIHDSWYEFRGDNNPGSDPYRVTRDQVLYHYTGHKIPSLGAFVLFAQSWFGIWSITGVLGIAVGSDIVLHKIEKINRVRYFILEQEDNENET